MASRLLGTFGTKLGGMTLVPSSGGCFEVTANGEPIYSKLQTGRFPDEQEIVDAIQKRVK